jgi:hypothetical protein
MLAKYRLALALGEALLSGLFRPREILYIPNSLRILSRWEENS